MDCCGGRKESEQKTTHLQHTIIIINSNHTINNQSHCSIFSAPKNVSKTKINLCGSLLLESDQGNWISAFTTEPGRACQ